MFKKLFNIKGTAPTLTYISLTLVLALFTNADWGTPETASLTPDQISAEINQIIADVDSGEYGETGDKALYNLVTKGINYLAVKIKARSCNDLREYVPRMISANYLLWNSEEGNMVYCRSSVDFVRTLFEEIRKQKATARNIDIWMNNFQILGFVETIIKKAEYRQSRNNPLSSEELVKAIFRTLYGRVPGPKWLPGRVAELEQQGLRTFIKKLATAEESLKKNTSFFDGIKTYIKKARVSGGVEFHGWACFPHSNKPLKIEIYSDNYYKRGTDRQLLGVVHTTRSSDLATNTKCGTPGSIPHNFKLEISQRHFKKNGLAAFYYAEDPYNGGTVYLNPDKRIFIPRDND